MPAPTKLSTFFASLRMPKPEMTSITPSTISETPTTNANVTTESNGYCSLFLLCARRHDVWMCVSADRRGP